MSEVGNEDAGGVLARLMRGANLRRSVEVLKAPDESLAATVSALANTAGGWILIGPDPEDGWRSAVVFDAEAAVEALRGALMDALTVYQDGETWETLEKRCMTQDFSWTQPAKDYVRLYEGLLNA